jgi:hypothetical protein
VVEVLHEHLTEELVENAYEEVRDRERKRAWTLSLMLQFWTAVVLRAPQSLKQALREAAGGRATGYPTVEASPQAFFKRSHTMNWEFFAAVFRGFVRRIASREPARFAQQWAALRQRFGSILIVDGSNLDPVARVLKVVQGTTAAPIPGAVLALYDLCRGTLADLLFTHTLREGELTLARRLIASIARGVLLVADRQYGAPAFFAELAEKGLWGVFRRHAAAKMKDQRLIERTSLPDGELEDWEVTLGVRAKQRLRLIRLRRGKKTYEFLTNVLDPRMLSAREVADLYKERWKIERLFQELKHVLNLKFFYCGNTNAAALQVYTTAIVHTAMRVAQGRIAQAASIEPEVLSVGKLFPLLAATSAALVTLEVAFLATEAANAGTRLQRPDWSTVCPTEIELGRLLVDTSRGSRARRKPTRLKPGENPWQELPAPPSARKRRR